MAGMDDADVGINTSIIKWHNLVAGQAEDNLDTIIG